jgi:polar amino acid transport system substrate-binding protein
MTLQENIKIRIALHLIVAQLFSATKPFISTFVLLLTLLVSSAALSKTLNIATIELAPFGFFTEDKKQTGMMYEISNLIAEEAGMKYVNYILPYARTSFAVASGRSDFVLRFTNEQLSKDAIQVISVVAMRNIVIGLPGIEYNSLSDLHGKTVASLRGAIFDKQFSEDTKIKKNETKDYQQGLRMLFKNRLDGIIGSNVGIYYTAHKMNYSPAQLGKPLFLSTKSFWLHFSKKNADAETIAALKAATIRLQEKGVIEKVINKYMGEFKLSL